MQLSLPSVLILLPLLLLLISEPTSRLASPHFFKGDLLRIVPLASQFVAYSLLLSGAATLVCGNFNWLGNTWGASYVVFLNSCVWRTDVACKTYSS